MPFEQAEIPAETKDLVRRSIFVEPLPFVSEVVFICTPHRGSFLADERSRHDRPPAGRLFPATLTKVGVDLVKLDPAHAARTAFKMPTAIDNMDGSHPFIKTLSSLPIAPGVEAHSIIAVKGDGPPEAGDDGVVKYSSAHIDGVASEFIVREQPLDAGDAGDHRGGAPHSLRAPAGPDASRMNGRNGRAWPHGAK